MGESKRRKNQQKMLLRPDSLCIYCAVPATTIDHCPPRSFFSGRHWPETFEFPACEPCNADARRDEQALAVLFRSERTESGGGDDLSEWKKLVQGVKNNQPDIFEEWFSLSRNEIKHGLRQEFGIEGDELRRKGWGVIKLDALTHAAMKRFIIKLGKALYFKHNNTIFDGVLYISNGGPLPKDLVSENAFLEYIKNTLKFAPEFPTIKRNGKLLNEQFFYRFNYSPEHGVMHAVVRFSEQFMFQVLAVNREMDQKLTKPGPISGGEPPFRHECFISYKTA